MGFAEGGKRGTWRIRWGQPWGLERPWRRQDRAGQGQGGGLARAIQTEDSSPTEDVGAGGPERGHGDFSGPHQPHQPCAPSSAFLLHRRRKPWEFKLPVLGGFCYLQPNPMLTNQGILPLR